MRMNRRELMRLYRRLLKAFGPRKWWPATSPFEVMVGAILTQNTAWSNVEKAVANLRQADALDPLRLSAIRRDRLARLIRPSGYYNVKAGRLLAFARWLRDRYGGNVESMAATETAELRRELLGLKGVGPETADSMLLYALERPVFVVDAYTIRIFSRHGVLPATAGYEEARAFFEERLPRDVALYNEYHALLVALGNSVCRPTPRCEECPAAGCLPGGRPDAAPAK